jgi:hypothetical protein
VQQQQQQQQPHEEENTCVENDAEYLAMLQQFRDALTL